MHGDDADGDKNSNIDATKRFVIDVQPMPEERDWRHRASNPILLLLYESGVSLVPMSILYNLETRLTIDSPSRATVTSSLRELREAGMIHKPRDGETHYELTDDGIAYCEQHLDPNGRVVRGYSSASSN
jgi:hypothetical protein